MRLIYNPVFWEHDTGMHPENKKRLSSLGDLPITEIENGEQYLELIHTPEYIRKIKELSEAGGGHPDIDSIVSSGSYEAAVYAVGATIMASKTGDFACAGSVGHALMDNIIGSGFDGIVYPVNPKRTNVLCVKAYKTIQEVPDQVDLAIIATPAKTAPAIVEDGYYAELIINE